MLQNTAAHFKKKTLFGKVTKNKIKYTGFRHKLDSFTQVSALGL